jgi:hypothetical protein
VKVHGNWAVVLFFLCIISFGASCGGTDDDDDAAADDTLADDASEDDFAYDTGDDDIGDDTTVTDDDADDDSNDDTTDDSGDDSDDTSDDDTETVTSNPNAKADAFRLFYKERSQRLNLSLNRFSLSGDAVAANAFAKTAIAKAGDSWEVAPGPEGNNPFGKTLFATWKLYQAIGGRDLELALIRMFEGIVFNEAVSGHPGLTTREAFPGWTRTMDGIHGEITRNRWGLPFSGPETYDPDLEQEILGAFFNGVSFVYRENPEEWLFNLKAVNELTDFAVTYVFDELDHDPPFLRVSDCCSSFMVTQMGMWEGAYWGNQNSRDNFTDYAMGFLAAFEAEGTGGLPDDLATAAHRAAQAARRTGDNITAHDNILMTVDEWHDYNTLSPAGQMNPDGEVEWQDLGSLATCQMAYVAHAVSTAGLSWPVPQIPLPGAIETSTLRQLFDLLGLDPSLLPVHQCYGIDDAFVGLTWKDMVEAEIFGIPLWDVADILAQWFPDLFPNLLGSVVDDFSELMLGAVALCYYARTAGEDDLFSQARQTLSNFIEIQKILARLVYGVTARSPRTQETRDLISSADEMLYNGALYARMFGFDSSLDYFNGFSRGDAATQLVEGYLSMSDTADWSLISDEEIAAQIEAKLAAVNSRAPWRVDRYRERFGDTYPVRRAGEGYECIGTNDEWMPTENPRHEWFFLDATSIWFESTLCVDSPETLDCSWARLGCAPADFDNSGSVEIEDAALFSQKWTLFGEDASCSGSNNWCDGADLDRNSILNSEDQGYMDAAQGCVV